MRQADPARVTVLNAVVQLTNAVEGIGGRNVSRLVLFALGVFIFALPGISFTARFAFVGHPVFIEDAGVGKAFKVNW